MKHNIIAVLYTTVNNNATGVSIAKRLLEKRLIVCANIFPKMTSMYLWNGEISNDEEVAMIMKTTKHLIAELTEELKAIHPYEIPCILEIETSSVNEKYLEWAIRETSQ